ncbi:MAG: protein kinase domain-containing protein [Planctomycetales bacterium]
MIDFTSACDPGAIESLLGGDLSDDQTRRVEAHLETCAVCRGRIVEWAIAPQEWSEIRTHLSEDELVPQTAQGMATDTAQEASRSPLGILKFLSPTDDPQMLGRLGQYEVSGIIGSGGMGVVLKGFDRSLNRFVAIKVLAPHLAANAAARRRFSREAQAAAAVMHDNVVAIHGVSEAGGLPFLVMPYVRGRSLQKRIEEQGVLSVVEVLRIGHQVAAGLAAAHAQGLVHRDIKPANILLEEGVERLRITDFGLARAIDDASLTQSGVIAGTPQFMSPEQARGDAIDPRSDLFSLGSVLYVLCTGRPPFRAETTYGILRRITDAPAHAIREINAEIPDWLAAIVHKLLAKNPQERFASAEEVAGLLEQCLAHVQRPTAATLPLAAVRLVETSNVQRSRRSSMRRFAGVLAVVAVGCAALGLAVSQLPHSDPDQARNDSNAAAPEETAPMATTPVGPSADSLLDWSAAAKETDALLEDGEQFEQRMEEWWGPMIAEEPAPEAP